MKYHPLTKLVYPTHGTVTDTDLIVRQWLKEKTVMWDSTDNPEYDITDLLELTIKPQEQTLEEKFDAADEEHNNYAANNKRKSQIAKEHFEV